MLTLTSLTSLTSLPSLTSLTSPTSLPSLPSAHLMRYHSSATSRRPVRLPARRETKAPASCRVQIALRRDLSSSPWSCWYVFNYFNYQYAFVVLLVLPYILRPTSYALHPTGRVKTYCLLRTGRWSGITMRLWDATCV